MRIRIQSTTKRPFRRAGIEFTTAGVELDLTRLAPEQVAALKAEPRLKLTELGESDGQGAGKPKGKKAA